MTSPGIRGRAVAAVALAATVGAGLHACTDFEGLVVAGDGGVACILAHPPSASDPAPSQPGAADFTVVAGAPDFGDIGDGGPPPVASLGYDLDDACTGPDGPYSCVEPPWAAGSHVDGPHGIDNEIGNALYTLGSIGGPSATQLLGEGAILGKLQMAIRVRGYAATDRDQAVEVAYYGVTLRQTDGGQPVPLWNGNDAWDVYRRWLLPPDGGAYTVDAPAFVDPSAYVTQGAARADGTHPRLLVSRVGCLVVSGTPAIGLTGVVVTAEIVESAGVPSLANIVVAGRANVDDLLHQLAYVGDPTLAESNYCKGKGEYEQAKMAVCNRADISSTGEDDGTQPCDASSWAWRYSSSEPVVVPLGVGTADAPEPGSAPGSCDSGFSPLDDHCDPAGGTAPTSGDHCPSY